MDSSRPAGLRRELTYALALGRTDRGSFDSDWIFRSGSIVHHLTGPPLPGTRSGCFRGRYSADGVHTAFRLHEHARLAAIAEELADAFLEDGVQCVVTESIATGDWLVIATRILVDAAVAMAAYQDPLLRSCEFHGNGDLVPVRPWAVLQRTTTLVVPPEERTILVAAAIALRDYVIAIPGGGHGQSRKSA
jgi:hypothetical protein